MISGDQLAELLELRACLRLAMDTVEDVYWRYGKEYVPDMQRLRKAAGTLNDKHPGDVRCDTCGAHKKITLGAGHCKCPGRI